MTTITHPANAALTFLFAAVLALGAGSQAAETVYKYRNEKGATTYSDTPPRHTSDYEQVTLPGYAPGDPKHHEATLEQITETSNRLQADRLKRQKDREKPLPPAATAYYSAPVPQREIYLMPGYPYRHHRPHPQRPQPPYRIDNRRDTLDAKLRTPIPMPSFGSGENLRDR